MADPAATAWRSSASRPRWPTLLCLGAIVFVLAMVALRYDHNTGFTSLIQFGTDWEAPMRITELNGVPLATVPGGGYDGQFYAQIAVQPDITTPEIQDALDNPSYRARRILLPLTAHVLGAGNPARILNIYALINVVAWLALAAVWWREVGAATPRGAMVWLACLLSLGALDSLRLSLTDLPAALLLVLAVLALERSRPRLATLFFLLGGFIRETSIFPAAVFIPQSRTVSRSSSTTIRTRSWFLSLRFSWRGKPNQGSQPVTLSSPDFRLYFLRALAVVPVLAWCAWLHFHLPGDDGAITMDWPTLGLIQHLATCTTELAHGNLDSRYLFGLLGALGLAYQSIFLLRQWRNPDPWVRLGLPFAILFWLMSAYVFSGYWAAARACLPPHPRLQPPSPPRPLFLAPSYSRQFIPATRPVADVAVIHISLPAALPHS